MKPGDPSTLVLPEAKIFRQACNHDNGWSDHYGALHVAAAYAGVELPARYFIKSIWMHGCGGPWLEMIPGSLYLNSPKAKEWPVFVARRDEVDCLVVHGLPHVRAIALPIAYTPAPPVTRQPGSLLVMPAHTLVGDDFSDRTAFERYADEIAAVAPSFRRVVACIHPNCRKNGLWVREFSARGFEIVYGAQTNDANALLRMRVLFEQFESMTTNGWGGHVAYALAFGARVSIHGTLPSREERHLLRDDTWAADKDAMKTMLSAAMKERQREFLKDFFRAPGDGLADVERGRWFIGWDQRLSADEMRGLLPQMIDPPPRAAVAVPGAELPAAGGARPRRVLFVSHEASRTGAPMFLLHFLRWLRRETDLAFEVLLAKGGGPLEEEFRKLCLVHSPRDLEGRPDAFAGYDLVYANTACNSELLEQLPCGSVPVVTHVHELDFGFDNLGPRRMAACLRQTDRFIACAARVAERLTERFGVPAGLITVHHEMIDASAALRSAAAADAAQLRRQHGIPDDARVVAACGTQDLRKGIDLFLQLAQQLKAAASDGRPWRFLWIGSAPAPDISRMIAEDVRKAGLGAEVRLTGELADPHALLSLADVFCLTSRDDPFPLAMLEAAALGKPVLAFDGAGGAREFCDLGGGLAVPYLDVSAMADACRALCADDDRRLALGRAAAGLVAQRFTVEAIAPALWETVRSILDGGVDAAESADRRARPLAEFFAAWPLEQASGRPYIEAHLARDRARRQARELVTAGRKREAVQLLVKAVGADLATKDAHIILESLVEIAGDLGPLDAKQAGLLLERAEQISNNMRIDLARFRPPARPAAPSAPAMAAA